MIHLVLLVLALLAPDPREVHLANIRQLTFGGENAEATGRPTESN